MKQTLKKDARIVDICPGLQLCPLCSIAATNRVLDALVAAHEGTIFSICVLKDGTLLTGGKDRKISAADINACLPFITLQLLTGSRIDQNLNHLRNEKPDLYRQIVTGSGQI